MVPLTITSLTAGALTLILVLLAFNVSFKRRELNNPLGDGNDKDLLRRMRAHGNAVEYIPMAVILLGLIEVAGAPSLWVWGLAVTIVLGRVCHAIGFLNAKVKLIIAGMILTHGMFIVSAILLLSRYLAL